MGVTCIKTVERQNIVRHTEAQEKWNDGGARKITRRAVGGSEGTKPRKQNTTARLSSNPTPIPKRLCIP